MRQQGLFDEALATIEQSIALAALAEIRQWREASPTGQLNWRWSAHYRELVQYDAYHWLTPAALSPAEMERWEQLQEGPLNTESLAHLEGLMTQSRDREIQAALGEGREPRFTIPAFRLQR